ncbi:MAG: pyridoxamine 5'-phosphate oxidase family protein [Candidatus Lernaella stagnicola]|nr:pyridoxamine 5'-phosphate oxidase family protein [Candidatus Lernaella stagnicola]
MDESTRILARIDELFREQRFAVLATKRDDAQPYGSLVAFAATEDLRHIVFATLRGTRKFRNIVTEPRVALVIDNRSNDEADLRRAMAVTALGTAREIDREQESQWSPLLLAKHPAMTDFVATADCALLVVKVTSYLAVTEFQHVTELQPGPDGFQPAETT